MENKATKEYWMGQVEECNRFLCNMTTVGYCKAKKIIVADCDGVLTNGQSIFSSEGKVFKTYGSYDKEAIRFMQSVGWRFDFVTDDLAGYQITSARLRSWKLQEPSQFDWKERANYIDGLRADGWFVLYVGDSVSDLEVGKHACAFYMTRNGSDLIKSKAAYVSRKKGGEGGFADILYRIHDDYKFKPFGEDEENKTFLK